MSFRTLRSFAGIATFGGAKSACRHARFRASVRGDFAQNARRNDRFCPHTSRPAGWGSRNDKLVALDALQLATSQSLDLNEILDTALEMTVELSGWQAVDIRLVEGSQLVLKKHRGVSAEFAEREAAQPLGRCLCGQCAVKGEIQATGDLLADQSRGNRACVKEGLLSSISIPLQGKDRIVGVIHIGSGRRNAFGQKDREILIGMGKRVAIAVENAQLYAQARRRAKHLEMVSLAGQRMSSLLDCSSLLDEVVRILRDEFGYSRCSVMLLDKDTKHLVLKEACGPWAALLKTRGLRLKIGEQGISGWVANTGQALLCNDVRQDPRYWGADLLPDTQSELAVPLRIGARILGVLDVQSDRRGAFDKEDVMLLQIIGNQLAIAIDNARLFQETGRRYDAMVALHETSLDIVSQLDRSELLQSLLRRGAQLVEAQGGALFLSDPHRESICAIACLNDFPGWRESEFHPGEGIVGQVVLKGQPLIVNDYVHEESTSSVSPDASAQHTHVVAAPIKWQAQVIGAIVMINDEQRRPFEEDDAWLLGLFAGLASIAIKNAEFHLELRNQSQVLEQKVNDRTLELAHAKEQVASTANQLRLLFAKTIRIQEEEQARIARDMHDGTMQLLTAARYELQAVKALAGSGLGQPAEGKLKDARQILDEIEKELRHAIYDLHPSTLDAVGLVPALQKHRARFQELSGVTCGMHIIGTPIRLAPSTEIAIYRMIEEGLQNIAAHANAKNASVTIAFDTARLTVTIQDDGQGFDYEHWAEGLNGNHLGLIGMRERVQNLSGDMQIWSQPNQGTRVTFHVPIREEDL